MSPAPADRRPTMDDVARRAGVSRALVSIVFRDVEGAGAATRERVRAVAAEIGYMPDSRARLLSRRSTGVVGVTMRLGHEFHNDLVAAIYDAAAARGLGVVLQGVTPRRSEDQAVSELAALRCEGLLLLGPTMSGPQTARVASNLACVVVARSAPAGVASVRTDDIAGARMATDHLLGLGHRAIAHVDGDRAPGAADRRRGYRAAMRASGCGDAARVYRGGDTEQDGRRAAQELLDDRLVPGGPGRVTAVAVFNDQCASGVLDTVRRVGLRVPEDLSVVGFDDSSVARTSWARLTTIAQDAGRIGAQAVDALVHQLATGEPAAAVLVPGHLVVRETTAPPPR